MKVALLISGYLRTFKSNVSNIERAILDKFDNIDTYIHITKHENEDDKYLNPSNIYDDIKFINDRVNPISLLIEDNIEVDGKNDNIINTWLKFHKLNEVKKINENLFGEYDLVIKCRPDLNIMSDNIFDVELIKDMIYIPEDSKIDKGKLQNIDDSYICDVFAFGKSKSMDKYFSIYEQLPKLIKKFGSTPETILYNYLHDNNIKYGLINIDYEVILSKCNVFGICGDSGSGKTTLGNALKKFFSNSFMLECDRYHKWERGDENWQKFTHLNPDANYITKMNEDIFNLKVGNDIHQVDYNHSNGKFTEKQLIEASDNTIICGLHSLYQDNDNLYNLKIFIDTDKGLKTKWKIDRDVKERGHKIENVIKQINNRNEDFIKYIYPQKYKSDVVINFFNDDVESNDISLRMLVNKKHDISKIINTLNTEGVKYKLSVDDEMFISITFDDYKPVNLWGDLKVPTFYDFYDYVIFFILNIDSTLTKLDFNK